MAEQLTLEQRQAVENRGGRLLVSAAAGSGKTKVLVDRLMGYVTDPDSPADLDDFLIITYTKAAAAELRGKIGAKLTEKIAQQPHNRHLHQQIQRLYLAKISTVHSFCADILRDYAYRLDLSADFRVADENECLQLQLRAMEQILDEAYAQAEQDTDFRAFVDTQGLGRDDRQIPQILLKVYHSARCHLDPEKWLSWCVDSAETKDLSDTSQTVWGAYLMEDLRRYLDKNIQVLEQCAQRAACAEGMEKPATLLSSTVSQLTYLRDSNTWDDVISRKNIDYGRVVFSKKCTDLELIEQIKAVRNACKKGLTKRLRSFADNSQQVLADLSGSAAAVRGLVSLVRRFDRAYGKLKQSRRILDFGDLEHKTLELLLGKSRSTPTAAAAEIGSRFREIMVDEYQDSNGIQDAIFAALTAKRQNCFMVGDVKQSIYQFRLADPGIFIEKYNTFVPADQAQTGQGRKVLLSKNFRSGNEVIQAVNDVFSRCMSPRVGGLAYGQEEMLREGISHRPLDEPAVELYGIEVQEDTYAEEAAFTAQRISELLDGTHTIRDGDAFRPIRPEDIVILLRSPGSVGGEFRYALEQRGIRCATGGNTDLLQTEEVETLLSLLKVIANPLQDIPLAAVLMSRLFGFTADDMAHLRSQNKKGSLFEALSTSKKGEKFCQILHKLRLDAGMNHVPELLEKIFLLTRMDTIYAAMEDGAARSENLQAFCQYVSDYDASGGRDLGQLLEHLEAMQERGLNIALDNQQAGFVSIMSIHKSKGLEFPVVFLCGLSRSFNHESAYDQVLCDRELGLGLSCVEPKQRIRYPSVAKRAISAKIISDGISEEMRVLYVAMTRARDRLIMTYAVKNLEADLQDIAQRSQICDGELMTGEVACPGEWILQTAMSRTEAGEFFAIGGKPEEVSFREPAWLIKVVTADTDEVTSLEEEVAVDRLSDETISMLKQDLSFVYPHISATQIPSKQTATQLKGRMKDQEAAENTVLPYQIARSFRKPSFVKETNTAAQYGNAHHILMQHIRYDCCGDIAGVQGEVERLARQGILTEQQAQLIDCRQIVGFFETELGRKLRESANVLREFKFSILDDGAKYVSGMDAEQVLLQGVVDCALIEPDGITVIDFKTNRVTEDTVLPVAGQYRTQVLAYADALERIYQMPVKSAQLYFFRINRFVPMK
ncbi:MAG: helicase-exonuclease AddAB subunit AddA [Oscillospiraceae bacterium]|nr:helicase-exonuclease AddAB subunit AddA [Oscillospiraceae bacterium]